MALPLDTPPLLDHLCLHSVCCLLFAPPVRDTTLDTPVDDSCFLAQSLGQVRTHNYNDCISSKLTCIVELDTRIHLPAMARLSGLSSEHHHEGPGDAPRRKRGRPSKNQITAEDVVAASKRGHSPGAESSHTTKRTKRTQVDDDEDQIAEEMEQSFSRSQHGDAVHVATSTQTTARRHTRRQSEPLVMARDADSDDDIITRTLPSTQPVQGLTPHLDRVGASRNRFTNTRRARMSMPAQLSVDRVDEVDETDGTQIQFAPLTTVLDGRTRRRLRRSHLSQEVTEIEDSQKQGKKMMLELHRQLRDKDDKIKDLEYRLEARRLGNIDITDEHTRELEQELEEVRNEIDDLRASSLYNGDDQDIAAISEDDEDELLLVNPGELHMSQDLDLEFAPHGEYASRLHEVSSKVTLESFPRISQLSHDTLMELDESAVPDKLSDQAIERYKRELEQYSKALGESQGALRTVTLELQNLHFIEAGAPANEIIIEMRHGFETLRTEIEKFVPGSTSGLTNQELLHKIPKLFGGIFLELKEKMAMITSSQRTEVLLRRQYEGVLDLLGESEDRMMMLEKEVHTLDKTNEQKQRTILDLEERNARLTTLTAEQEAKLADNDAEIAGLQDETEDKETNLTRLRDALETYRLEVDTITETATTFEQEHHGLIARMEKEHADAIQVLEAELGAEQEARDVAEIDAQQKTEYIDELESSIARMESDVDAITAEMTTLRERLANEIETRTLTEVERDEQVELVYEHANTIENLNETIAELKEQLDEFRNNLRTERSQREKTEADLDEANDNIEDLTKRLHEAGVQANELRAKLFQVQQEKENTIARLREEAGEREDVLTEQLETETQLRVAADNTVIDLQQQIVELQAAVVVVETNITQMTQTQVELEEDRELQVTNLSTQLGDLKAKYAALENSTNSTITSLQANITDLTNQVQRQQAEIKRLVEEVADKERVYEQDITILQEKNEELEDIITNQKGEIEGYRKENDSLSHRVESEANELLNIMGSHNDEVDSLKAIITTQNATIKNLQNVSADRTAEHEEILEERYREITELQLMGDARAETIVLLEANIEHLKDRFRIAEEDTRVTIDALTLSQRQLQDQNEKLAAALKERNAAALQAIQEMKLQRIEVKTQGVDLNRVVAGKVTKTSEKVKIGKKGSKKKASKRQWDSGFGIDENVEEEEVNGEDQVAV